MLIVSCNYPVDVAKICRELQLLFFLDFKRNIDSKKISIGQDGFPLNFEYFYGCLFPVNVLKRK